MEQLHALKKGAKESVTQYATRVCNLAAELSQAGHPQSQGQVAMSFLKGLPSHYNTTVRMIKYTARPLTSWTWRPSCLRS